MNWDVLPDWLMSGASVLRDYLMSGASVCPYAKTAAKRFYTDADTLRRETAAELLSASRAGEVLILCASGAERSWSEALDWCEDGFRYVWSVFAGPGPLEGAHVEGSKISPRVSNGGDSVFVIGMGPQYLERHPRYAPQLCLVVVREADIKAVPPKIRESIHHAMSARAGHTYDPNSVWLDWGSSKREGSR